MADRSAAVDRQLTNPAFTLRLASRSIGVCMALAVGVGVLAAKEVYDSTRPDRTKYFASNPNLEPYALVPMDQPAVDEVKVLAFADEAVRRAYTINHHEYRRQSTEAMEFFEGWAWQTWAQSFLSTRNLETIKRDKLQTNISPLRASSIRQAQVVAGRYTWEIHYPAIVTVENVNGSRSENRLMKIKVRRSDDPKHLKFGGIALSFLSDPPWMGEQPAKVAGR